MKVLITGFEPFGKHNINPSQELLKALPETINNEIELIKLLLPVEKSKAPQQLLSWVDHHKPDIVLCFGLASERSKICLERVAINLMDFRLPDNAGVEIFEAPIIEHGPAAYFSNLPLRDLLSILLLEDIPARISLTAGSFLCNQIFYSLMHKIESCQLKIKAGFIHLPLLPLITTPLENPSQSLSLEEVSYAVMLLLKALYQYENKA